MKRNPMHACLALCGVLAGGCGGESGAVLTETEDIGPRASASGLEGRTVYLRRRSSSCGAPASNPLIAEVGDGIEFPAAATASLVSRCGVVPNPEVEVSIEGGSVLFDFSRVGEAGAFPEAQFDGYELSFARSCGDVVLDTVSVDAALSSATMHEARVSYHYDRIDVDFQGLTYDQGSFVKLDLELADVVCFRW